MRRRDEIVEKAGILVFDYLLEAYGAGDLPLEKLCRMARQVLLRVSERERQRALGAMVERALALEPPPRKRGNPGFPGTLRRLSAELAAIAHDDHGHPLSREASAQTAFHKSAEILADLGVVVTDRQVEDWYYSTGRLPG